MTLYEVLGSYLFRILAEVPAKIPEMFRSFSQCLDENAVTIY